MFILNETANTVSPLQKRSFTSLKLSERNHLQKWILDHPEMLGEPLLIITEEFDGWNETRERLDVLALDEKGQLVIIENKLDDSGRDVVWQAMKYAAYCSSLSKAEITKIYADYLGPDEASKAEAKIAEFLGHEDFSDVEINEGSNQRLILTAAKFRPEVTATALWMIDHQINIQCMRITPYSLEGKILLNVEQVIPPQEAKDFMIKISQKKSEEQQDKSRNTDWVIKRKRFWNKLTQALTGEARALFQNRTASLDSWMMGSTGISAVSHTFNFHKNRLRYQISIQKPEGAENSRIFEALYSQKEAIETDFGHALEWKPLDGRKACRIQYDNELDCENEDNWPEAIIWLNKHMNLGIAAFQPRLDALK